jgi:hypothetical protein
LLIQDDYIPASNTQYLFFLHGRNNTCAESLGRHGCVHDVGVIPPRPVQDMKIIVHKLVFDSCRYTKMEKPRQLRDIAIHPKWRSAYKIRGWI